MVVAIRLYWSPRKEDICNKVKKNYSNSEAKIYGILRC